MSEERKCFRFSETSKVNLDEFSYNLLNIFVKTVKTV